MFTGKAKLIRICNWVLGSSDDGAYYGSCGSLSATQFRCRGRDEWQRSRGRRSKYELCGSHKRNPMLSTFAAASMIRWFYGAHGRCPVLSWCVFLWCGVLVYIILFFYVFFRSPAHPQCCCYAAIDIMKHHLVWGMNRISKSTCHNKDNEWNLQPQNVCNSCKIVVPGDCTAENFLNSY